MRNKISLFLPAEERVALRNAKPNSTMRNLEYLLN
jgi:hypothetical protein